MQIYRAILTLLENTYFASREVGTLYESEPLVGNYALTYGLGLCAAPYDWSGPPRYKQDLGPLNERGLYVTPATFLPGKLRFAFSQFNAQSDSYYFRFDQNAIATTPNKRARAANFPQSGKIRMLGLESQAHFYLFSREGEMPLLPGYIRLGKFNSKARVEWERLNLLSEQPREADEELRFFLNAVDLPASLAGKLRAFSIYNIYPAPLLSQCRLAGPFWQATTAQGERVVLPAGMRYGVDAL
ncbi:type I-D CRISPR-associated protein Cas5/Csc1 [Ktedonobacter racemifer]|uniref:CRISPR-associated protein Csc1 n=1 Tax=Ktedonobacter racemifer DSM 44963 TaxID=485913 RepID=D6TCK0_KTERA|nr:type I-D CRISPR-associated protein Cas5/Csc1 [Ktedonobacter racemifer]EFH90017.1 CRISPR-associated protein Csc1 [Ktedonobacter racemifer DSM 44963]